MLQCNKRCSVILNFCKCYCGNYSKSLDMIAAFRIDDFVINYLSLIEKNVSTFF